MNKKAISFIKNVSYTLTSNVISFIISVLVTLIVPKLVGVNDYGYWQLYLFYSSYVGFMHLGWNDGIYLRYGGSEYRELDKKLFYSQFYMFVLFQGILSLIVFLLSLYFIKDHNRVFIIQMTSICMFLINVRQMLLYILQGTYRIKEHAQVIIIDRVIYIVNLVFLLLIGIRDFQLLIISDLVAKVISLFIVIYFCKDILLQRISVFYFSINEMYKNISVGSKLMFANIAGMLIIGIVRFGIERVWNVSTFGKVSLTLNLSNFMMLFISAIGIIMFPILRRTEEEKLPMLYKNLRDLLMLILFGALLIYFPLSTILVKWLPEYKDSLRYMAILFPIVIFEGKTSLLINTYLKTFRMEKTILWVNLVVMVLSLFTVLFTIILIKNLDLTILSIVFLLATRCVISEYYLSKRLEISVFKDINLEIVVTLLFIIFGWYFNSLLALIAYSVVYLFYLILKRREFIYTINELKRFIRP
ncbi:hypothetical protein M1D49_02725 [Bacillus sp. PK3-056]|uniref:hypothetical protein n=1 Tax=Niallia circulans TaxID=1397 RepID=UPI000F45C1E8|nr:hypothetical protein [Niallia circulans]AYV73355.1 hypothetical protein C2H98_18325 [Niallia circulans]